MSDYYPDTWVVVKIGEQNLYKVFACWYGGYAGSDSWKLNSGITKVTLFENCFQFEGSSGSVYYCGKYMYGTNGYGRDVLSNMIAHAGQKDVVMEVMPENTNWLELKYE
jgi:ABC-type dipeptide/oligopeptide/nickel transport system permease subunit